MCGAFLWPDGGKAGDFGDMEKLGDIFHRISALNVGVFVGELRRSPVIGSMDSKDQIVAAC